MHRDIGATFDQIYNSGFVVRSFTEEELNADPTDPEFPNDHLLVSGSQRPPEEALEDLERLRTVGALELKSIDGEECYVLTEEGFNIAHDRETHHRQIALEKRQAKRERELSKGAGLVTFALVMVTTVSVILRDWSDTGPNWLLFIILMSLLGLVLVSGVYLLKSFQRADTAGWDDI